MLTQQVSGYWKRFRAGICPVGMRACSAKPDQKRAEEDQNLGAASRAPHGFSDPRVIEAFMNMRCC